MKMFAWLLFLILMIPSICNAMHPAIDEYGKLLLFGIQRNDEAIVQDAITRSKNAGIHNLSGMSDQRHTPIFVSASGYTPNTNILQMLLNNGAQIDDIDLYGETALMKAITSNPSVISFLVGQRADVNVKSNWDTPLTIAVKQNDLNLVKVLLGSGGDPNDYVGLLSPLGLALEANKHNVVLELIERGANYTDYMYHPFIQQYEKAKSTSPYELYQRELGIRRFP